MNNNFINMLKGLNNPRKIEAVKLIMSKFKEQSAIDNKFYSNPQKLKTTMNNLIDIIDTTDVYLSTLIQLEGNTPYSIFKFIIDEDFSDVMIYGDGYLLSDSLNMDRNNIPEELLDIYRLFLDHFIQNVMFLSSKKFDTANAILDAEIGSLRFNIIHNTLSNNGFPIIVIRKQMINKSIHMTDEYLDSINASQAQKDVIHKYAQKGNFIIFGEVGSGKTTLLKYMANYKLEEKRNLCTIEDTKELNLNVPISLLTNHKYKIKDLFTAALRQNPSAIIIGETRTDEIVDILESALTISVGTTIHANSFPRAIERIIFMAIERDLTADDLTNLINAAVDCFIFMEKRKIKEVWIHKNTHIKDIYESYEEVK